MKGDCSNWSGRTRSSGSQPATPSRTSLSSIPGTRPPSVLGTPSRTRPLPSRASMLGGTPPGPRTRASAVVTPPSTRPLPGESPKSGLSPLIRTRTTPQVKRSLTSADVILQLTASPVRKEKEVGEGPKGTTTDSPGRGRGRTNVKLQDVAAAIFEVEEGSESEGEEGEGLEEVAASVLKVGSRRSGGLGDGERQSKREEEKSVGRPRRGGLREEGKSTLTSTSERSVQSKRPRGRPPKQRVEDMSPRHPRTEKDRNVSTTPGIDTVQKQSTRLKNLAAPDTDHHQTANSSPATKPCSPRKKRTGQDETTSSATTSESRQLRPRRHISVQDPSVCDASTTPTEKQSAKLADTGRHKAASRLATPATKPKPCSPKTRTGQDENTSSVSTSELRQLRPRKLAIVQDLSVFDFTEEKGPSPKRRRTGSAPRRKERQVEEAGDDEDSSYQESSESSSSSSEPESSEEEEEEEVEEESAMGKKASGRKKASREKKAREKKASPITPNRRKRKRELLIPDRKVPARVRKVNNFDAARERLHPSAVPGSLPCREEEFESIYSFVEEKLLSETGGFMYISGLPGTGKTATVQEVMSSLRVGVKNGELPHFKLVEVNGMRLTDPKQVFVTLLEQLTGEKKSPDNARASLHSYFSGKGKPPTVLFADELDLLSTRRQKVLYELMTWPTLTRSRLVLLGVANTMDLPDRIGDNKKLSSRMGASRVTFLPYTHQQLREILSQRVCDLGLFELDVIDLAVRKVASLSGDIRRALDLLSRAVEITRSSGQKKVKIPHLQQAIEEMFSSAMMRAVKHCSLHQKLLLKAVLAEFQRSGVEEAVFWRILEQLEGIYTLEGVRPLAPSLVSRLCTSLCGFGILLVDDTRRDLDKKIRLNLTPNDLKLALFTD